MTGDEDTQPIARRSTSTPPARPRFEFRSPPSAVRAPRPQAITVSWACWLAGACALLVTVGGPLLALDAFRADLLAVLARDYPNETAATRDRVVTIATAVLLGGGALLAALEVGCATMMRSGRAGAKLALVLLLGPVGLHALLLVSVSAPVIAALLGVEVGLALVAAALMFTPGCGAWFETARRR